MEHATRNPQPFYLLELPLTDYHDARQLQLAIVEAKTRGILKADVVVLLEHPAVYTLGRRGGIENLTVSQAFLEKSHIQVVPVERGGNITYHGPGQLVAYPIIDLNRSKLGIADLVFKLEEIMIRTAETFGTAAKRDPKNRGVWVGNRKLGSIGIAVRRGISFHGFALNVKPSLKHFEWINPCGLRDTAMTSLKNELGTGPAMVDVRNTVVRHMQNIFQRRLQRISITKLKALLCIDCSAARPLFSESGGNAHDKGKAAQTPVA
jgi:lipoate-protein ligase B